MLGLVLEGGGAKGAFHVGAIKALLSRNYEFSGVAGTSIGALNGAIFAQGDFEECIKFWESVTPSTLIDVDDEKIQALLNEKKYTAKEIQYLLTFAKNTITNKGLSLEKLEGIVEKYIDEDKLRNSKIDFCLVTVDISSNWKPVEMFKNEAPDGMLKKYILASAYYPAFRRPRIDGKTYIDGGLYDNRPVNPLIRRGGYNKIIVISTLSKMPSISVYDKSVKVDYIIPSTPLGKTLELRNSKIKENMQLGYYDAFRYMDKLLGEKFYVKRFDKATLFNFLENLNGNLFVELSNIYSVEGNKKILIETFFADIKSSLKLNVVYDYPELFIKLIETISKDNEMERFRICTIKELISDLVIDAKKIKHLKPSIIESIKAIKNGVK